MVKFLFIKAHYLKLPAMMLTVAVPAVFTFYIRGGMITPACVNERFHLGMAVQTFGIIHLLTKNVAFGAVAYSFETRVSLCEFTR